jgi:hypothetical protein
MYICKVQASYPQPAGVLFFIETFTACDVLLPVVGEVMTK